MGVILVVGGDDIESNNSRPNYGRLINYSDDSRSNQEVIMTREEIKTQLEAQAQKDKQLSTEMNSDIYKGRAMGIRIALKTFEELEERDTDNKQLKEEIKQLREDLNNAIRQRDQKSEPATGATPEAGS